MKENEKRVSILVQEGDQNKSFNLQDDKKSNWEKLKKPMIFVLMGVVFLGSMYLIFKPTSDKKETENMGLNDVVPQASEAGLQKDKQKAYEQEMLEQKDQEKRKALTTLSDYWNEETSSGLKEDTLSDNETEENNSYAGRQARSGNSVLYNYRNAQNTLGSFYKDDNAQTNELRRQLDELKEQLAEKELPKAVTVDDQLALMEKSYQMAAKYLPAGDIASTKNNAPTAALSKQEAYFMGIKPARKNTVSALYREPTDSAFLADWNENKNRGFYTSGSLEQVVQPKNSIKACVQETKTIIGESGVRLRLLEPAQTPNRTIPQGTIITANAKFQAGRLQLKVTSIEFEGNIIPVDITIYDLDGQQGLYVPYSPEVNALTEMAGNMSQTSGTSLMLTQSAGQQMVADLSRGMVQGISGYFSKKVKTPKVTLKAGHQVFLVSKK